MKRLSIFTIILFAFGLYLVPASFATGAATDSKQSGQSDYHKDQTGLSSPSQQEKQTFPGQPHEQDRQRQSGQLGQVGQQSQQQNLMLGNNLIGTEVQNQKGEQIGEIDKVLVDVDSGRIGFVTMKSGGIFGMGEETYIVPFNALQNKMPQGTQTQAGERQLHEVVFTLDKQKDQLKMVPEGDIEEALTQDQSRGIHEHYGVSPYWEDGQSQQQRQDDTQRQMMQDKKNDQTMDKKDESKNQKKY
ncbi:MAG: PRC-barrel domain-containing protein [Desulfopila sp.]